MIVIIIISQLSSYWSRDNVILFNLHNDKQAINRMLMKLSSWQCSAGFRLRLTSVRTQAAIHLPFHSRSIPYHRLPSSPPSSLPPSSSPPSSPSSPSSPSPPSPPPSSPSSASLPSPPLPPPPPPPGEQHGPDSASPNDPLPFGSQCPGFEKMLFCYCVHTKAGCFKTSVMLSEGHPSNRY